MKTLKTIILCVGGVSLWGVSGLYAQTVAAEIPFDFSVRNTTLPAGKYTMERKFATSGAMVIRNVETNEAIAVFAPSNVSEYKVTDDRNVVLFHRVGDRYFLAEVKTAVLCGHVAPSKVERELASEGSGPPMAAVIVPALSFR